MYLNALCFPCILMARWSVAWDRAYTVVREHPEVKEVWAPPVAGVLWHFLSKIIYKIQINRQKSERSLLPYINEDDCNASTSSSAGYYLRWIRKTVYNPKRTRQAKKVDGPGCTEGKFWIFVWFQYGSSFWSIDVLSLQSHILAAKAVANILRTSLGPKGKLIKFNK